MVWSPGTGRRQSPGGTARSLLLGTLCLAGSLAAGCGHAIAPGIPFQHAPRFDFRHPPACAKELTPAVASEEVDEELAGEDLVVVRYLGVGGLYIEWRGEALLTGPFFTNPGLLRSAFGRMKPDVAAVQRGLKGIPREAVGAILVGHSHYDHAGDLGAVAKELGPRPAIYLNRSGAVPLATAAGLGPAERIRTLEHLGEDWIRLRTAEGDRLPFRMLALPSHHAPHLACIKLYKGETSAKTPWDRLRNRCLREGRTYAFVLDLLGPEGEGSPTRFRIYYQDSAAEAGRGFPPTPQPGDPPYDLAVTVMPSAVWVEGYPEALLDHIEPRHALVTHYENFFRPWGPRRGFVPLLTQRQANGFLKRTDETLAANGEAGSPPVGPVCGPSSHRWTMPLTGEWLRFRPSHEERAIPSR